MIHLRDTAQSTSRTPTGEAVGLLADASALYPCGELGGGVVWLAVRLMMA